MLTSLTQYLRYGTNVFMWMPWWLVDQSLGEKVFLEEPCREAKGMCVYSGALANLKQ